MADTVDVDVQILERRHLSVLVKDERGRQLFLPLSKIEIHDPEGSRLSQTVTMPEWLAIERELI